jgi:signal transduction histidine kinase
VESSDKYKVEIKTQDEKFKAVIAEPIEWLSEDRLTLLLLAAFYPLWGLVAFSVAFSGLILDIPGRIMVALFSFVMWAASYRSRYIAQHTGMIATLCICVMEIHYQYLVYINSMHYAYRMGSFILIFAACAMINRARHLMFFSVVIMGCAIWSSSSSDDPTYRRFYLMGLAASLGITLISTSRRFQVIKKVKLAQNTIMDQHVKIETTARLSILGEMAGGIAHEINTPLAAIAISSGLAQTLIDKDPEKAKETLKVIDRTVQRIAMIIRGLRNFSREADGDPLVSTPIQQIIDDVLSLCHAKLAHQQIKMMVTAVDPRLSVECRPVQIAQVIMNLISNAADALKDRKNSEIRLHIINESKIIKIVVEDNGPGIPINIRQKIFQPFFTTKEIGKGTGLGLSISKGLVESHHGRLELADAKSGTRFTVILPKKQTKNQAAPQKLTA